MSFYQLNLDCMWKKTNAENIFMNVRIYLCGDFTKFILNDKAATVNVNFIATLELKFICGGVIFSHVFFFMMA